MTYDLTPIVTALATLITALGSALVLWIGIWLKALIAQKYQIDTATLNDKRQSTFDYAAERSLDYGRKKEGATDTTRITTVDHPVVQAAAGYLEKGWPDLVKNLDIKPEQVKEALLARASPADTPTRADTIVAAKASGVAPKPE